MAKRSKRNEPELTIEQQVLDLIKRRNTAPNTVAICNALKCAMADTKAAIRSLRESGQIYCRDGYWILRSQVLIDKRMKPRGSKKPHPESAEARTLEMFE